MVQLEDLRQQRAGHLGTAANRLSADPAGHAQPRAARLLAPRQLLMVSLPRQPAEIPDDPGTAPRAVSPGTPTSGAGGRTHRTRRRPFPTDTLKIAPPHTTI